MSPCNVLTIVLLAVDVLAVSSASCPDQPSYGHEGFCKAERADYSLLYLGEKAYKIDMSSFERLTEAVARTPPQMPGCTSEISDTVKTKSRCRSREKTAQQALWVRSEFERLNMSLMMDPISLAELSDHIEPGSLNQKVITSRLVHILKGMGASDPYVNAFRDRRRLIADLRAEMKRLYNNMLQSTNQDYDDIAMEAANVLVNTYHLNLHASIEEIEENTRSFHGTQHNTQLWQNAVLRYIMRSRGVKAAAYLKRLRLDHEGKSRVPKYKPKTHTGGTASQNM